jgi:hypothetical protein
MKELFDYESKHALERRLKVLNNAERRVRDFKKQLQQMDKVLNSLRLDIVYVRTVDFGRGKGSTGKEKNMWRYNRK